ncbi:hypothetical protein SUGI_0864320 [Cryptomeria japonica]|nr:hypothetical protein SUGI_0864320 [Cryptomeria japonica]
MEYLIAMTETARLKAEEEKQRLLIEKHEKQKRDLSIELHQQAKKLADRQKLESQIERLESLIETIKVKDGSSLDRFKKIEDLQNHLKDKNDKMKILKDMNQQLMNKERQANDKEQEISKSVNKIMETKMLTDELKSLDGVKNSKPSDYRRHVVFKARNNPMDSNTISTSEEDPLLCSLIPASLRNSSKIRNFEKQNSKNLKLTKGTGKPGTHQTNQSAVLGKRKVSSCMEGLVYNEQENCKYCEDSDKKSVKAYPKIKVKIVPVDNGTFRKNLFGNVFQYHLTVPGSLQLHSKQQELALML